MMCRRIRIIRHRLRKSQTEMGELYRIEAFAWHLIETGKAGAPLRVLQGLCTDFDVSADFLLLGAEPVFRTEPSMIMF